MTNQWLTGNAKRESKHLPIRVILRHSTDWWDSWSLRNKIAVTITAKREDGDYQRLYLTKEDLRKMLREAVREADGVTRRAIAMDYLLGLDSKKFGSAIAQLIARREGLAGR